MGKRASMVGPNRHLTSGPIFPDLLSLSVLTRSCEMTLGWILPPRPMGGGGTRDKVWSWADR